MAQEITVMGVVHDNEGETLPGVSVVVKGSAHGTVTDIDGNFEIKIPQGATLEFSYVGYQPQEIKITDQKQVNVILTASTVGLDEVVVVGYGTQSRRTVTSAITKGGGSVAKYSDQYGGRRIERKNSRSPNLF